MNRFWTFWAVLMAGGLVAFPRAGLAQTPAAQPGSVGNAQVITFPLLPNPTPGAQPTPPKVSFQSLPVSIITPNAPTAIAPRIASFQLPPGTVVTPTGLVTLPGTPGQILSFQLPPGSTVSPTGLATIALTANSSVPPVAQTDRNTAANPPAPMFDRGECTRGEVYLSLASSGGGACLSPQLARNLVF